MPRILRTPGLSVTSTTRNDATSSVTRPVTTGDESIFQTDGVATPADDGRGGLPAVLKRTSAGLEVRHGTDPGDFYCEHMFFTAQGHAMHPGSTVLSNSHGERLVGFLHVPGDAHLSAAPESYRQADRHRGTREVVGAALRGYYDQAARQVDGPVRLLVTGYGAFQGITNNPTGDFVSHRVNLDAAMRHAFGDALLTPRGRQVASADGEAEYAYRVRDESGRERELRILAVTMPVDDRAIDGRSARSVQRTMDRFGPHAVLSLGVSAAAPAYLAEHHADNGGLALRDGRFVHDASQDPTVSLPDNFSLARAIHSAGRPSRPAMAVLLEAGGAIRA